MGAAKQPTSVLVLSDVLLFREGLRQVLEADGRLQVVGCGPDIESVAEGVCEQRPQVVLLDMGTGDAIDSVRQISSLARDILIVAMGVSERDDAILAGMEAGVAGYVCREGTVDELVETVERAARGELHCSDRLAGALVRRLAHVAADRAPGQALPHLTPREFEVLRLVNEGLCNKEIASRLIVEVATVKNHIHNILVKLKVHRRGEAAAKMRSLYRWELAAAKRGGSD